MIVSVVNDVLSSIDVMVLLFIVLLASTIFDWGVYCNCDKRFVKLISFFVIYQLYVLKESGKPTCFRKKSLIPFDVKYACTFKRIL